MSTGDTIFTWQANSGTPTVTDGASPDRRGATDPHNVIDFSASTAKYYIYVGKLPQHYAGGGTTTIITGSMASATSGDVDIDIAWESGANLDTESFAAAISSDGNTVPGTSGDEFDITVSHLTSEMDGAVAGSKFRIKINRDSADTAAGDFELGFIEMRET